CGPTAPPGCVNNGDQRVPVRKLNSDHDGDSGDIIVNTNTGTIDATLPADPNAVEFELWSGSPPVTSTSPCTTTPQAGCLYARAIGSTPVITTYSGTSQLGSDLSDFSAAAGQGAGQETSPAISPNGSAVAWVTANGIVVQKRNASTNAPT